uniref:Uncharacterized protein n=1 Tax=Oryza punctata TaxID=4537 RepID=A0A0E0K2K9_ORYPU
MGKRSEEDISFYESELEEGEFRDCRAFEHQTVKVRQLALHGTCSGEYSRSYSPHVSSRSNKRHKQKEHDYYKYSDYLQVLKKIEKVSSRRFDKLLSWHNEDREEFNAVYKNQEFEFFQEHLRSYEVQYTRVIPTIKRCRMKLPKLLFSILHKTFHKHFQSQLIEFVKRQIKDRDKEKRVRNRWIFEAEAGYLKTDFYMIPLSYSGLKIEKLKCSLTDYLNGDALLNYFNMECLSTEIEAIASSSTEPEETRAGKRSDTSEPILDNSGVLLEINVSTKDGVSVGAAEEVFTCERSSQSTCGPTTMVFGQNNGRQIDFPVAVQSNVGDGELSYASQSHIGAASAHANVVAANSGNANLLSRAKGRCPGSTYDVSLGSCSGSHRELPFVSASSPCETALLHKEAPCANHQISLNTVSPQEAPCANHQETPSASPPSTNVIQMEQSEDISNVIRVEQSEDISSEEAPNGQASSFAQVIEQPNMHANTSTCQAVTNQPPDGSIHSVRTEFINPRASNTEPYSVNQILTRSIFEQHPNEAGFQWDPVAVELNRLQMLRALMAKRHEEKRQQIILAREIEMAEAKRKYDELIHKLEMETSQRKKGLQILADKVYKQQTLAEGFQTMFVSHGSRARRTMAEHNRSSGQQALQIPASVSAPASAVMCQPSQQDAQSSMGSSPRHSFVIINHHSMDSLGRSATPLAHSRGGGMGSGIVYHAPEPHRHSVVNPLPASGLQLGIASLEQ